MWAMAEESDDDGDGPPPHADADEPELIDMPPAPASAPRMSNLERCIALRLVYGAGPRCVSEKIYNHHHITSSLSLSSHASVLLCRCLRSVCPAQDSQICLKKCCGFCFSGEVGSDGLKWCPHKVMSAHMLACTAVNRP